jgi:endonuclease/exonuclease/phosphatase family metal-dependent hydrolase
MATRIFLASWNLDNVMFPPNDLVRLLRGEDIRANTCDIIVLGLQEAKNTANCIDLFQLYTQSNNAMGTAYWSFQVALFGHTKTKDNYQVLAVLVNPNGPGAVGLPTGYQYGTWGEPVNTGSVKKWLRHHTIGGEEGKGGIVIAVDILHNGVARTFAFTSAHLDSRDPVRQNTECDRLEGVRAGLNPVPDVSFVMGDLNYRLNLPPVPTPPPNQGDTNFSRRMDQVAKEICSSGGRANLFTNLDTLGNCHFVTQHGYTFPPPRRYANSVAGNYFFPTYKRKKNTSAPVSHGSTPLAVAEAKRAYGFETETRNHIEYVKESRAGQFDAGWLDRIGYKSTIGANFNIVAFDAMHDLNISDHVPIYMVVDVN